MFDWASSGITQIGFLRVSMNRSITVTDTGFEEVLATLDDAVLDLTDAAHRRGVLPIPV